MLVADQPGNAEEFLSVDDFSHFVVIATIWLFQKSLVLVEVDILGSDFVLVLEESDKVVLPFVLLNVLLVLVQ